MPSSVTAWAISSNNTRLHKAAYNGDVSTVMKYIGEGDDINARNSAGSTPLHSAFYFPWSYGVCDSRHWSGGRASTNWRRAANKFAVAKLLVDHGANTSVVDKYGHTPLDLAPSLSMLAKTGQLDAMKWLCELDGTRWNPTEVDNQGRTPLHAAAYCGRKWTESHKVPTLVVTHKCLTADWLVSKGCGPDQRDYSGNTPRTICTAVYRGVRGYEHTARPGPIYGQMGSTLDASRARHLRDRRA